MTIAEKEKRRKMLELQMLQADYGDCLILKFGNETSTKNVLIDGGPKGTYNSHLKQEVRKIQSEGGKIDYLIVSHVDDDHIRGVIDLMLDIRDQKLSGINETLELVHSGTILSIKQLIKTAKSKII